MNYDYDLVVVGAGPGGSNFARLMPMGRRILVLDGSAEKEKVCAGLLSPDAQDLFARYGLNLPGNILSSPQLFRVRTVDLQTHLCRDYRRSYLNLDRAGLDAYLRSLIPSHITVKRAVCRKIVRQEEGFLLTVREGEDTFSMTCRLVVGADGASSVVRRDLFDEHPFPRYTAIQEWYDAPGTDPFYSCIFDSETSDSCSWIFFKDQSLIFGGAFPTQHCSVRFSKQKEKLISLGLLPASVAAHPIKAEACLVAMPTSPSHLIAGGNGAFLIGESAGMISPSSLEGISYAMRSGELLASSLRDMEGEKALARYRAHLIPLAAKVMLRAGKRAVLTSRPLRTAILKSGICSLPACVTTSILTVK